MKKGYTLIEVLVAVSIFTILVAGPTGLFITALRGQRKALAVMEIVDNSSYALEYISRALRMAKKQTADEIGCLSTNGLNYEIPFAYQVNENLGWGIKFINYKGDACQEFYWDKTTNQLMENKTGYSEPLPLTSADLEIVSGNFKLSGQSQDDDLQPSVTISFEIQKGTQPESKIRLQTTISQRNLDVSY